VLVTGPTLALVLVILELVFRFGLPASQQPWVMSDPEHGVLRYDPAGPRTGTASVGPWAAQRGRWRINEAGWNSPIEYRPRPGRPLVAVIGDSYVEGFQVDVGERLVDQLHGSLTPRADAYGFGISGAPLSQYLQMSRYARAGVQPDVFVFLVVHNDLLESLRDVRPHPALLQLSETADGLEWTVPVPYRPDPLRRFLGRSALVRYLVLNLHVESLLTGRRRAAERTRFEANVSVDEARTHEDLARRATARVIATLRAENPGTPLVFVMDGLRGELGRPRGEESPLAWMGDAVRDAAHREDALFLDLHPVFAERFEAEGPFQSKADFHWNAAGHRVAARALEDFLAEARLP